MNEIEIECLVELLRKVCHLGTTKDLEIEIRKM